MRGYQRQPAVVLATVQFLNASPYLQITRGLLQKYGAERVRDTPITEVLPPIPSLCSALGLELMLLSVMLLLGV